MHISSWIFTYKYEKWCSERIWKSSPFWRQECGACVRAWNATNLSLTWMLTTPPFSLCHHFAFCQRLSSVSLPVFQPLNRVHKLVCHCITDNKCTVVGRLAFVLLIELGLGDSLANWRRLFFLAELRRRREKFVCVKYESEEKSKFRCFLLSSWQVSLCVGCAGCVSRVSS